MRPLGIVVGVAGWLVVALPASAQLPVQSRPAGAPSARLGPTPLPEARTDAPALLARPSLSAGDGEYVIAMGMPLAPGPPFELMSWAEGLMDSVRARRRHIDRAQHLYERDAVTRADRALAHQRVADLLDALGAAVTTVSLPAPVALRGAPAWVSVGLVSTFARPLHCEALRWYRSALALDPSDARSRAQLDAYGAPFAEHCDAEEARDRR